MWRVLIVVSLSVLLIGCSSPNYGGEQSQSSQVAAPAPYPSGEYITTAKMTPAADTAVDFTLAIKAMGRNDRKSIQTLHGEGFLFNLPKGTRLALLPAEVDGAELQTSVVGTVENLSICVATVESGDRIGTNVALGCESLAPIQ